MTPIQVAMKKLTLSQECLDGKLELGIPWDPLATGATAMETCKKSLQRPSAWTDKGEQGRTLATHREISHAPETFHKTSLQGEH